MMLADELVEIFKEGVKNASFVMGKKYLSKRRCIKLCFYFVAVFLLNKYTRKDYKDFFVVNGKNERVQRLTDSFPNRLYVRNCFTSVTEISSLYTLVSEFPYGERFNFFKKSVRVFFSYRKQIKYFFIWFEFYLLYVFISYKTPHSFISRGHYDDITTWLGLLAEKKHFEYVMYQHGVVSDTLVIPHKIYCNKLFLFDSYSKKCFQDNIIRNSNCELVILPYMTSVSFEDIEKEASLFYVGIAEQNNYDCISIVLSHLLIFPSIRIVIMKHPLSKYRYKNLSNNVIVTEKKIRNLDAVLTFNSSTLLLDYASINTGAVLISVDATAKKCFENYPIYVLPDLNNAIDFLKKRHSDFFN